VLELRDYQEDALARTAAAEARGVRKQLGVAATGLGKTVMVCALAERRGGRALVIAHRDELVTQAAAKVLEVWPELGYTSSTYEALRGEHMGLLRRTGQARMGGGVGIIKAGANDAHAHVIVASVQTLARDKRLAQLVRSQDSLLHGDRPVELVVVDEAHHAAATTYRKVLAELRAGEPGCTCGQMHERAATPEEVDAGCELGVWFEECPMVAPGPLLLGVTATPDRGDGKGLDDLFQEVVWSYDILWGIRAGYLSDLQGKRVKVGKLDLSRVKVSRGDYDQGQAGAAMEEAGAPAAIVKAWKANAEGRKTLVFTPTVALAEHVAGSFDRAGIAAAWVHGGTPLEERRELLRRFSAGDVQVLANCAVLTEGYDEPSVSCVVVARPTKSRALYTQMVGRGTRRYPTKDDCLVLDVVGATDVHSLVTVPSLFGIKNPKEWEKTGDTVARTMAKQVEEEVRLGRLTAEDAELFAKVVSSGIAWVELHKPGDKLRRYVRPMGKDQPVVVLAQREEGDVWTSGLQWADGTKQVLVANVAMEMAQGVGEDYVRKNSQALGLVSANAEWRKRKPSPKALAAAGKWRMKVDPAWNAGELSDKMEAHIQRTKAAIARRRSVQSVRKAPTSRR
jgi:ATP-dependent helicase IRC3